MKKKHLIALLIFVSQTIGISAAHQTPTHNQVLKELASGFTEVAKHARSAVVFIESQISSEKEGPSKKHQRGPQDNPFDHFQDDFFNRFFNFPYPEKSQKKIETVRGSGFIIRPDGYIVTNYHVVDKADKLSVTLNNGKKIIASIVGTDPKTDLAVIKIDGKDLPYLRFGNSDQLEVGEWAIAVGNPFGLQASVTVGVVSAKGRNQLNITDFDDFLQTDAAINPGNSGGPLLNLEGDVIGINTAIVSGTGGYMGVGFAIPSSMAMIIIDQLIDHGHVIRGFLGVTMQQIDTELASFYKLNKVGGALVTDVIKGSPADKAGLRQEDIILSYNGNWIESINSFRNAVSLMVPGSKLNLEINRDGKTVTIHVVIGSAQDDEKGSSETNDSSKLGIQVQALTPDLASQLGYGIEKGVLISQIQKNSLAEEVGLKPGNLILAVNRKKVTSIDDYHSALQKAVKEGRVLLMVRQGEVLRFVTFSLN